MRLLVVTCLALSLMSSLVACAADESPLARGQRIEVPALGVAVNVPEDWEVRLSEQGPGAAPGAADFITEAWILATASAPTPGAERCLLARLHTTEANLVDFAEHYRSLLVSSPDLTGPVESMEVGLPAGRAFRVDAAGNIWVGASPLSSDFFIGDGDTIHWLGCWLGHASDVDRADVRERWLRIAATIELAPVSPVEELAARFPADLEGRPLEVVAASGAEWIDQRDPDDPEDAILASHAEDVATSVQRDVDDMTIATAIHEPRPGAISTIAAVRVDGVPATSLVYPVLRFLGASIHEPVMRWRALADTWIIIVRDLSMPGSYPVTLVPIGDTVWVIQADQPLRDEIVTALPPQPPLRDRLDPTERVEVPELGIAVSVPDDWEVDVPLEPADPPPVLDGPDVRAWQALFLREPHREPAPPEIIALSGAADPDFCSVGLYAPTGLSPRTYVDALVPEDGPDVTLEEHDDFVRLPAGPGNFFGAEVFIEMYVFSDGGAIAQMMCVGEMPPGGRWLPLAESFEFLPIGPDPRGAGLPVPETPPATPLEA